VHETLAVETETRPRPRRSLSETRPRRDVVNVYKEPVLGVGELLGLRTGPMSAREAPRPWDPAPVCEGHHTLLAAEGQRLRVGAVGWARDRAVGSEKYVMN